MNDKIEKFAEEKNKSVNSFNGDRMMDRLRGNIPGWAGRVRRVHIRTMNFIRKIQYLDAVVQILQYKYLLSTTKQQTAGFG
jgi:hypothetical protein